MNFKNKTVVITGSANGIGKAIAERFASNKANIAMIDIDKQNSRLTASQLKKQGVVVKSYIKDLSTSEGIERLYQKIVDDFGKIHIVVNAAGILKVNRFLEVTQKDWDDVMDLNAKTLFFSMQEAAKQMIKLGVKGRIINISSITAKSSRPDYPVYAASKATILSLTRSAASALSKYGILVNAVCPGLFQTAIWDKMDEHYIKNGYYKGEIIERMLENIPLKRMGELHEIASMVIYLASSEASYITGQAINVDGGAVMH